jgi:hypothetical protein
MFKTISFASVLALTLATAGCGGGLWPFGSSPAEKLAEYTASVVTTGSFAVDARDFKPFKITVPEKYKNARIEGTFAATGGSGNDVEVMVLDETQFLNWQNRNKFSAIYESGRVTADKLNVAVPSAGTYVVVFSNRFSLLSTKGVKAELKLAHD